MAGPEGTSKCQPHPPSGEGRGSGDSQVENEVDLTGNDVEKDTEEQQGGCRECDTKRVPEADEAVVLEGELEGEIDPQGQEGPFQRAIKSDVGAYEDKFTDDPGRGRQAPIQDEFHALPQPGLVEGRRRRKGWAIG